jgi:hypothetical protein
MRHESVFRFYTTFLIWRAFMKSKGKLLARSLFWKDLIGEIGDIYEWIKINRGKPYVR